MTPYVKSEWSDKVENAFNTAYQTAKVAVRLTPDSDLQERAIRCHELTRALARAFDRVQIPGLAHRVLDGTYLGRFSHSWLGLQCEDERAVLDVYAVGQLPQVQLIHDSMGLCQPYRPSATGFTGGEIYNDVVEWLLEKWNT